MQPNAAGALHGLLCSSTDTCLLLPQVVFDQQWDLLGYVGYDEDNNAITSWVGSVRLCLCFIFGVMAAAACTSCEPPSPNLLKLKAHKVVHRNPCQGSQACALVGHPCPQCSPSCPRCSHGAPWHGQQPDSDHSCHTLQSLFEGLTRAIGATGSTISRPGARIRCCPSQRPPMSWSMQASTM